MKSAFPILVATTLLLSSDAQAMAMSHAMNHSNIIVAPTAPITTPAPTLNPGALMPQSLTGSSLNPGAIGSTNPFATDSSNSQNFGALPGNPGSPTFDPYTALPGPGPQ